MLLSQCPNAVPESRPVAWCAPVPAVKRKNAAQVPIILPERNQVGPQPPKNLALRQVQFQQAENRQRLHHVSERTRFENENFHGRASSAALRTRKPEVISPGPAGPPTAAANRLREFSFSNR